MMLDRLDHHDASSRQCDGQHQADNVKVLMLKPEWP